MGYTDLILFPLYVYLFHLLFAWRRKKITDPLLRKYHLTGFWLKIFATFAAVVFNVYISPGDSTGLYYLEGNNIFRLILQDPENLKWLVSSGNEFDGTLVANSYNEGYFRGDSNYFVIRLVALFSFVSFGSYAVISLFFSMLAFSGIWKLFKFFYDLYPDLHKQLAVAIIFLPTVLFWSSGILKDPLCMGALGWFTYSINGAVYRKTGIGINVLISIVAGWVLLSIKPYILYAYVPFFVLYLILSNLYLIKNTLTRLFTFLMIIVIGIGGILYLSDALQREMGIMSVGKLSESVKRQQTSFINMSDEAQSSFSLGVEYDGSTSSLLKIAPAAINATFFRPYLWESKKISTLLSSIESLTLIIFTVFIFFKAGPLLFFKSIIADPVIMHCFFFSILFALFIGATTLNFGTLVRYKIPCMPFFIVALILINQKRLLLKKARKQGIENKE